jgi:hypothetical protein
MRMVVYEWTRDRALRQAYFGGYSSDRNTERWAPGAFVNLSWALRPIEYLRGGSSESDSAIGLLPQQISKSK